MSTQYSPQAERGTCQPSEIYWSYFELLELVAQLFQATLHELMQAATEVLCDAPHQACDGHLGKDLVQLAKPLRHKQGAAAPQSVLSLHQLYQALQLRAHLNTPPQVWENHREQHRLGHGGHQVSLYLVKRGRPRRVMPIAPATGFLLAVASSEKNTRPPAQLGVSQAAHIARELAGGTCRGYSRRCVLSRALRLYTKQSCYFLTKHVRISKLRNPGDLSLLRHGLSSLGQHGHLRLHLELPPQRVLCPGRGTEAGQLADRGVNEIKGSSSMKVRRYRRPGIARRF